MFGNALVLIVVYKSKQLRHSQYVYKCSVAISDIVWGSVISFYFIYISVLFYYENNFFFNESESFDLPIESADNSTTVYSYKVDTIQLLPKELDNFTRVYDVLEYVLPVAFLVSIVTLACAAGDRYAALTFPFRYRRLDSLKFAKIISAAVWILCAFCFLYTFFDDANGLSKTSFLQPLFKNCPDCVVGTNQKVVSSILFGLFTVLWVLTGLTMFSLMKNYTRMRRAKVKVNNRMAVEKQMSLVLVAMVVAFTFCLSLTLYSHACYYACEESFYELTYTSKRMHVSLALLATNSVWNFLIYGAMNKNFRSALVKLFRAKNKTSVFTLQS